MLFTITASVGQNGVNRAQDVVIVQNLLNLISPVEGGPHPLLDEDGQIGPETITAIARFQRHQFGWADGRVDPHQKTITRLNEILGRIIATVQRVLQQGYQILRNPRATEELGYFWPQLNQSLQNLSAALTAYAGTKLPIASAPPSPGLVGVAIVDDITLLILLALLLIIINHVLSSREFQEARDERARELNRRLEEMRATMRRMTIAEAEQRKKDALELALQMQECQEEHPTQNVDTCNEQRERYEKVKKRYLQKLSEYILCLRYRGCKEATPHFMKHLEELHAEFIEALNGLHECLGCTNF